MTKKDELIARLKVLGVELGREVNLSGSNEELSLRIAELEDELDDNEQPDPVAVVSAGGAESTGSINNTSGMEEGHSVVLDIANHVTVTVLSTLHIDALHETLNVMVAIAEPGTKIRVTHETAGDLVQGGLATIE